MTEFIEPKYPLLHLAPSNHSFGVTIKKIAYLIPITVIYRDHCYTRAYVEGVDDPKMLFTSHTGEKRIFCPDRWEYSQGLPTIMEGLFRHNLPCYCATQSGLYFKLDRHLVKQPTHSDAGWYLFFKLRPHKSGAGIALSVESNHKRTSWPSNARSKQSARLRVILTEYLSKRPELLLGLKSQE